MKKLNIFLQESHFLINWTFRVENGSWKRSRRWSTLISSRKLLSSATSSGLLTKKPSEREDRDEDPIRIAISREFILALAIIAICVAGATIRLNSLSETDLPYHLDGMLEARFAENIALTGSLTPEQGASYSSTHTIYTPAYDSLIALFSVIVDEEPMSFLQVMLFPISLMTIFGAYVLTNLVTKSSRAGIITAAALAVYGPFVFVTQGTWKEVLGISLIPLILVTFYMRKDARMRVISSSLILITPLIHHLVAIIVILTISMISVATFLQARKTKSLGPSNVTDMLITILAIDVLFLYYSFVRFDRLEYLTPESGLYLFVVIVIMLSLIVYYLAVKCISNNLRRIVWILSSIAGVALVSISIAKPIFTSEMMNANIVSAPLMAVLVISIIGMLGISIWASTRGRSKTTFFAIVFAPLSLILYAFLRAADLVSHDMITRGIVFMDLGLMMGLGTFMAFELKKGKRHHTAIISALVCILLLTTSAIAIDPEQYLGARNNIAEFEVEGIEWAVSMDNEGGIQTDRHYSGVARNLFDVEEDSTVIRRFIGTIDFESGPIIIASERWVTKGTNDFPFGWIQLEQDSIDDLVNSSDVLYIGGPRNYEIIILRTA